MTAQVMRTPLFLDARAILRIDGGRGSSLRAASGRVWITRPGSAEDTVLEPGERSALAGDDGVLVAATEPARIVVEVPEGAAAPRRVEWAPVEGGEGRRLVVATLEPLPWWRRLRNWLVRCAASREAPRPGALAMRLAAKRRASTPTQAPATPDEVRDRLRKNAPLPYY